MTSCMGDWLPSACRGGWALRVIAGGEAAAVVVDGEKKGWLGTGDLMNSPHNTVRDQMK